MRSSRRFAVGVTTAVMAAMMVMPSVASAATSSTTYTADTTYTVPAGYNYLQFTVDGAAGQTLSNGGTPGPGGQVTGYLEVTPGQQLLLYPGSGVGPRSDGGPGGGGSGGLGLENTAYGPAGGQASSIVSSGTNNILVIAGGGGGAGGNDFYGTGGAGGVGGSPWGTIGGTNGANGGGGYSNSDAGGGGGGGGYNGGNGGGGGYYSTANGGSGGSSYAAPASLLTVSTAGTNTGLGYITLTPVTAVPGVFSESLPLSPGVLAVSNYTPSTLSGSVGGTATGSLGSATWSDTTGSGAGWHGAIQLGCLSYTGTWQAAGSAPALGSTAAGSYTGTGDGVQYSVTVNSATSGSVSFSYSSNDPADPSGTGTATPGTAQAVGTQGVSITFGTGTTYASGDQYQVHVGTQSSAAISLDTSATGASIQGVGGSSTVDVSLINQSATVAPSGTCSSSGGLGTAVNMIDAASGAGLGTFTIAPGVALLIDSSAWVATYSGPAVYSIVTGP